MCTKIENHNYLYCTKKRKAVIIYEKNYCQIKRIMLLFNHSTGNVTDNDTENVSSMKLITLFQALRREV